MSDVRNIIEVLVIAPVIIGGFALACYIVFLLTCWACDILER